MNIFSLQRRQVVEALGAHQKLIQISFTMKARKMIKFMTNTIIIIENSRVIISSSSIFIENEN